MQLTVVSAAELGVEFEFALADVYNRARQLGLVLCPPEVGPQLRLDYRDQPLGESLTIAMEPITTHSGDRTILSLANFHSGLALLGSDGRSRYTVPRAVLFRVRHPGKATFRSKERPLDLLCSLKHGAVLRAAQERSLTCRKIRTRLMTNQTPHGESS